VATKWVGSAAGQHTQSARTKISSFCFLVSLPCFLLSEIKKYLCNPNLPLNLTMCPCMPPQPTYLYLGQFANIVLRKFKLEFHLGYHNCLHYSSPFFQNLTNTLIFKLNLKRKMITTIYDATKVWQNYL
jgi:hypothetical protein